MRKRRVVNVCVRMVLAAALPVAAACGGSSTPTEEAAAALTKAGDQLAKDIASGKTGSVEVVPFEKLITFLPELPGWTRDEPKGQMVTMGITMSTAEARYEKDDSELEFEISDSSMSAVVLGEFAAIMQGNYSEKTEEGYTKTTKVGGYPASEEWQYEAHFAQYKVIVANRFVVTARGNAVESVDVVKRAIEAIDLKGLAALK
jgi:hypothetical protein